MASQTAAMASAAAAGRLALAAGVLAAVLAGSAGAQAPMAQCRAELAPPLAARQRLCDEHAGCRTVARVVDSCAALRTFLELLANNGSKVDDSVLRRALIEAGVPPAGLPSCTSEFNRALCRNFLHLEDASGETASGPSRTAQFQANLRRLVEQQERARVPADSHRAAELKLEACAAARAAPTTAERESACREAEQAVAACGRARDEWTARRDVLLIDAERLGQAPARQTLRSLDMPPCPHTLPGSSTTPQQALAAMGDAGGASTAGLSNGAGQTGEAGAAAANAPGAVPVITPPPPERTSPPAERRAPEARTEARPEAATADCKPALRRMEERFEVIQRRRPAQPERLAEQQVEIFMLTEQVGVLERLCRGQREYDFLKPTQQRLARTLQGCRDSAANPVNDCVPRVAW